MIVSSVGHASAGYSVAGVDLSDGLALLSARYEKIVWHHFPFLVAGCDAVAPFFHLSTDYSVGGPLSLELSRPDAHGRTTLAARDLFPEKALRRQLADKAMLADLLAAAGVERIPAVVVPAGDRPRPDAIWRALDAPALVGQRLSDGLSGSGTVFLDSPKALAAALARYRDEPLKISRFVAGRDLSLAACIWDDVVLTSPISQQIVGVTELSPHWGAHCGNQILSGDGVSAAVVDRAMTIASRVGDRLRAVGYRGAFGLDLIATPSGEVRVVELNPRLISLMSLLNTALAESQLLPLPLAQLLNGRDMCELRPTAVSFRPARPLGQLVTYSRHAGEVRRLPPSGRYRLVGDTLVRTSGAASLLARNGAADTSSASDDEEDAVVWAFVAEGEAVEDHTVVAVVQARAELAAAERGSLTPLGHRFARALNALIEIGPEKGGAS